MHSSGCEDSDIVLMKLLYWDLVIVTGWVEVSLSNTEGLWFLTGKPKPFSTDYYAVIPRRESATFVVSDLQDLLRKVLRGTVSKCLLAFFSGSGSVVYVSAAPGVTNVADDDAENMVKAQQDEAMKKVYAERWNLYSGKTSSGQPDNGRERL
ncbi:unnamed protein product [Soboliphyme baturini]|uniref:Sen15 domain-containing protein n=1 Tax=Soboliphyme baturini TaxID=241478 RepID=A0A183IL54_9BILA|nr:unnamed protein product [Soboliphyme baturini]